MSNPNVEPTEVLTIDEAVRRFRVALLDWKAKRALHVKAQKDAMAARVAEVEAHTMVEIADGDLIRAARLQEPPIDWPEWGTS